MCFCCQSLLNTNLFLKFQFECMFDVHWLHFGVDAEWPAASLVTRKPQMYRWQQLFGTIGRPGVGSIYCSGNETKLLDCAQDQFSNRSPVFFLSYCKYDADEMFLFCCPNLNCFETKQREYGITCKHDNFTIQLFNQIIHSPITQSIDQSID